MENSWTSGPCQNLNFSQPKESEATNHKLILRPTSLLIHEDGKLLTGNVAVLDEQRKHALIGLQTVTQHFEELDPNYNQENGNNSKESNNVTETNQ